jgi:hypothetical protein
MTAMTLKTDRVRCLAETDDDLPPITETQADTVARILVAVPDEEDSDPAWDQAWQIAENLLNRFRPDLAGDIMEIGYITEQIYPLAFLDADASSDPVVIEGVS